MELNYSSDIDLMFVYSATGETAGPARITNKEFFIRAANQLTALLSAYTRKDSAIVSTCAFAPTAASAKCAFRSTARNSITKNARATGNCKC